MMKLRLRGLCQITQHMKRQRQDLNSGPRLLSSCSFPNTTGPKVLLFYDSVSAVGLRVGVKWDVAERCSNVFVEDAWVAQSVRCLPLAQVVIPGFWDLVLHQACREPASPSSCPFLCLCSLALCDKYKKKKGALCVKN